MCRDAFADTMQRHQIALPGIQQSRGACLRAQYSGRFNEISRNFISPLTPQIMVQAAYARHKMCLVYENICTSSDITVSKFDKSSKCSCGFKTVFVMGSLIM